MIDYNYLRQLKKATAEIKTVYDASERQPAENKKIRNTLFEALTKLETAIDLLEDDGESN
ncbi:MAG: hypothetical protein ACO1RA_02345 [Planctomycetaceae bacterium]